MLPEGEALPLAAVRAQLGFVPSWLEAKATLGHRVAPLLAADFSARFQGTDALGTFVAAVDVEGQLRGRGPVEQSLYLWSKTALAGYILRTLGDGMEMAHAVEGRLPFLDHRLFERCARSWPVSLKIRDGVEKWVTLREAMRGLAPRRGPHPAQAPLSLAPPALCLARAPRRCRTSCAASAGAGRRSSIAAASSRRSTPSPPSPSASASPSIQR